MRILKRAALAAAVAGGLAVSVPVLAGSPSPDQVKSLLGNAFPQVAVKQVTAGAGGMFEVQLPGSAMAYVTPDGKYLVTGDMIELATKRNVTRERAAEMSKIDFSALPLADAVKLVKGKGAYTLAVFSDPDCPFCTKLEAELDKLTNATVYIFPFPLPMHPNARGKAEAVYCAADPGKAWHDLLLNGKEVPATTCKNAVARNIELGRKLGVNGTPTVYFANGTQAVGGADAATLQAKMEKIGK